MHILLQFVLMFGMIGIMSNLKTENQQQKEPTVVYFVRHAEKLTRPADDPGLSKAGKERANALKAYFRDKPVDGLFTSPYKRTRQTLEPLAKVKGLTIREYSTRSYETLPAIIAGEFAGKTVLIAGHSNTLLETIEAFNVKRPIADLTEQDYNYLFKLTLHKEKAPVMEVLHYGKPNGN